MAVEETIDYKRYFALLKRDKKICIISALVIMTVVTAACYLLPSKYEAKSTVFIERSVIAELVKGLAVTPSIDDKIKVLTYAMSSRTLRVKVIDELDMRKGGERDLEKLIKDIQDNTQIKTRDREGLFLVSFRNKSPKIARDFVNALVRRYIDENTSNKRQESYGASTFISEQLKSIEDKIVKTEKAANEFKQSSGLMVSMDVPSLLSDINASQQRIDDLVIKQAQLESQLSSLSKATTVDSNLPMLQKRLQELQLQFTDQYPEIIQIKNLIRELEEQRRSGHVPVAVKMTDSPEYDRVLSELKALRQTEANLRARIAKNQDLVQRIPGAKAELENLEREKLSQKTLYENMASRQGQSEVSKQMEVQDKSTIFRIVDPAVLPIKPVSPNRKKIILLGILAGIGGGLGLVVLKDALDETVKSVDVARKLSLPLLAAIPRIEQQEQLALQARQDRKLYIASVLYFFVILAVLAWEILGSVEL